MQFSGLLFYDVETKEIVDPPQIQHYIRDLNIDQIIDSITINKNEYNLKPFFYTTITDQNLINYRQEIMHDLENKDLLKCVQSFCEGMIIVRKDLQKSTNYYYLNQKQRWLLDAAGKYCYYVKEFYERLKSIDLKSRGLLDFRQFLEGYLSSQKFIVMNKEIIDIQDALARVKYALLIKENTISVRRYEQQENFQIEIESTFAKFKQNSNKNYLYEFKYENEMNHIEAAIVKNVEQLFPDVFASLRTFYENYQNFQDATIQKFDREVQFYVSYLEYIQKFKNSGYHFCYPDMTLEKDIMAKGCFDLALANNLLGENKKIITNDFFLKNKERIIVVTGPNQGGKTTFARTFGQLHYFGSLGCLVPGYKARLFIFDNIFTHFEKQENIKNLRGKLQDDLIRFAEIFKNATSNSIFLINEIFSSTTLSDAVFLAKKIMEKISRLDALCVCVTFIDELSTLSEKTVSMVSNIEKDNPNHRTFKITRKPADGLSYALSIAEKYNLTSSQIKDRITS